MILSYFRRRSRKKLRWHASRPRRSRSSRLQGESIAIVMNKLYVFYGIACVGKSTLALRFAYEHTIRTIIHSDSLREVQRMYTQPPELMKVTHNAWELFGSQSSEHVIQGFIAHVDAVAPALVAVAQNVA